MTLSILTKTLANGLTVEFFDLSNRYYGDYYRVRVEVRCRLELSLDHFPADPDPSREFERVRAQVGDEVFFVRNLEKMGVAGGALETVRRELIDSFCRSSFPYLEDPGFPPRLIARELAQGRGGRRLFAVPK